MQKIKLLTCRFSVCLLVLFNTVFLSADPVIVNGVLTSWVDAPEHVIIPPEVITIAENTFKGNTTIRFVEISNSVKEIKDKAFGDCVNLDSVYFNFDVNSYTPFPPNVSGTAFSNCTKLTTVFIDYSFYRTGFGSSSFPYLTDLKVGEHINQIESYLFEKCNQLKRVELPANIKSIGTRAFANCMQLDFISIPGVTLVSESSFENCTSLTTIRWSPGLEVIGYSAFRYCSQLKVPDLPASLQKIGNNAFEDCIITSAHLFIPDMVTEIGDGAFIGCTTLKKLTIGSAERTTTSIRLGENLFYKCDSITHITLNKPFTNTQQAFSGLKNLKEVHLGDNIVGITNSMFANCSKLTTINIPASVTSIGNSAFKNCSSLPVILLPESVKEIDEGAFQNCISLASIYLPSRMREIKRSVFKGCSSLRELKIPPYVQLVSSFAFQGCSSLQKLYIPSLVEVIASKAFGSCVNLEEIYSASLTVPITAMNCFDSVPTNTCAVYVPSTSVPTYKLAEGWKQFTRVQDFNFEPDTITIIPDEPLYTDLNFPDTVIHVTTAAGELVQHFNRNSYKTVVKLKVSGTMDVADFKFINESLIKVVFLDLSDVRIAAHNSPGHGSYAADVLPKDVFYTNALINIILPNSLTGIGEGAFTNCGNLRQPLIFPASLQTIEKNAFFGCRYLRGVLTIPENVHTIGEGAFARCLAITRVVFKSALKTIPASAFEQCAELLVVETPLSVEQIGDNAFRNCPFLFNVAIPSAKSIGKYAFENALLLQSIDLPSNLSSIGEYAFSGCQSLREISFPKLITRIYNFTLKNCTSLEKVTIPASVTRIDYGIITNCTSIKSFYCLAKAPPENIDHAQFYQINHELCTLYVPWGSAESYKLAPAWKVFKKVEEIVNTENESLLIPQFQVFPNPASDHIVVTGISELKLLRILTLDGIEVVCKLISDNESISLEMLENGTYLVRVGEFTTTKLIVSRAN